MPGQGARTALPWVALNLVSLGAEATVAGWPGEEDLAFFNLGQAEADALFGVFDPIAAHLGLRCAWRRDGEAVTMTVERAGG